jgi:thioredoxin-related protein
MSTSYLIRITLVLAAVLMATSCNKKPADQAMVAEESTAATEISHVEAAHKSSGIDWYDGTLEQAFTAAKSAGKPIFLYWGAAWCPPCNQLMATVFKQDEFIAQSRLVVPVYLDGDTASAQEAGDRFAVYGYPTVIVFNPDGQEITRIPGGLDLDRYLDILQLALNEVRPVKTLVAEARAGKSLADGDWRLLAAYSWGQDNGQIMSKEEDKVASFQDLAKNCPKHLPNVCSQLAIEALQVWSRDEERDESMKEGFADLVDRVLSNPEMSRANLEFVVYAGKRVVAAVSTLETPAGEKLYNSWQARLKQIRSDMSVNSAERIGTWIGELRLAKLKTPDLSAALQQEALTAVTVMEASVTDGYERLAFINNAWAVLDIAGLEKQATELLRSELEKSHSPYYFMLDLASSAQKAGRTEEALDWLDRAWSQATGEATRLQWGANYLAGVIEMTPDDAARVSGLGNSLLDELAGVENAFHGRNSRVISRVFKNLGAWATVEDRIAVRDALRSRVDALCLQQNSGGCSDKFSAIQI